MAIAFYFKGGDLVIVYDLSENKKKNVYLWFWYDFPTLRISIISISSRDVL